ncbi:helix-turn-helix transcriptional regulator [Phascolarctobacterium faecium]|uniref:helix-turn-helix domain-containing protein n=1 Tax=Phascolarctobacterium faecium TaxID=33025 RepID=UPI003076E3C1
MTNKLELELQIKRCGLTKRELAQRLGISEMALSNKLNNESESKASEIFLLEKELKISKTQRDLIFFAPCVD